jgi:hypothetical protein
MHQIDMVLLFITAMQLVIFSKKKKQLTFYIYSDIT